MPIYHRKPNYDGLAEKVLKAMSPERIEKIIKKLPDAKLDEIEQAVGDEKNKRPR